MVECENGVLALNLMPDSEAQLAQILGQVRHVFLGRVLVTTLVDYHNIIVLAMRLAPHSLVDRTDRSRGLSYQVVRATALLRKDLLHKPFPAMLVAQL